MNQLHYDNKINKFSEFTSIDNSRNDQINENIDYNKIINNLVEKYSTNFDKYIPKLVNDKKYNLYIVISILLIISILILKINKRYLLIPILLIIYSFYYNYLLFNNDENNNYKYLDECQHPTENNPFMNYTIGDAITNKNRLRGCNYIDVKQEVKKNFRSKIYTDLTNLWGKQISDINFYTMPNSGSINESIKFANWCYNNNDLGKCKIDGTNCKIDDNTYFLDNILSNKN
jgi:hypothetical protein